MDKPGQLREVSGIIASLGGNVISVHHERASEKMDINGCFLRMVLETKNHNHILKVKAALESAGFKIS